MTNQQGAPEALRPIQRYKIGYHTDEWGVRSSTPGGISDPSGQWVLYKDHIAALVEAQQPAPSAAPNRICNTCQGTGIVKGLHNWIGGGTREEKCWSCHEAPQPSPAPQAGSVLEGASLRGRTADELTAYQRESAIAAYRAAHGHDPDFGFAPDRAWIEGAAYVDAARNQGGLP